MKDNKNMLHNPLYRLGELISILSYYSPQHTIQGIAQSLKVPIVLVRNDLHALSCSKEAKRFLFINGNSINTIFPTMNDCKSILYGSYDNAVFSIKLGNPILQISNDESNELQRNSLPFSNNKWSPFYAIKSTIFPSFNDNEIKPYLPTIEDTIIQKSTLSIRIKKTGTYHIIPIALYFDVINLSIYIVTIENNYICFLPLKNIHYLLKSSKQLAYPSNTENALNLLGYIWEPEKISLSTRPEKVVLRIDDQQNIILKIKHDISHHSGELIPQADGTFIYETFVLGMKSFTSWVLSYGSSITVLSPDSLRQEIRGIYHDIYMKYQK